MKSHEKSYQIPFHPVKIHEIPLDQMKSHDKSYQIPFHPVKIHEIPLDQMKSHEIELFESNEFLRYPIPGIPWNSQASFAAYGVATIQQPRGSKTAPKVDHRVECEAPKIATLW